MILISGIFAILAIGFLVLSVYTFYGAKKHGDEGIRREAASYLRIGIVGFLVLMFLSAGTLYAVPTYYVWQQGKEGESALAKATADRQIAIQEAAAKEEAAKHLAEAEILRSRGIAEANRIVSESLKGNSLYLQYLYIQSLKESSNKVIYIPVSSEGLPVLESARLIQEDGIKITEMPPTLASNESK